MKNLTPILVIIAIAIASVQLVAQPKQYTHPSIISFENAITPAQGDGHSQLSNSNEHFKHFGTSLNWKWDAPCAQWSIKQPINYQPRDPKSKDNSVSTFVFWMYSRTPLKEAKLKIEFLKNGRICSFLEYGLNFNGWRGAWIAFDRDMQGKPEVGMDEMRVTAPSTNSGELFFDHIILSSQQDVRQHTADFQAPYINPETNNHWLILLRSWQNKFELGLNDSVTAYEHKSINEIQNRLTELLLEGKKATPLEKLSKSLNEYSIRKNSDGSLNGLPIFFERFGETYQTFGAENYKAIYNNPMGLSICNQLMLDMAVSFRKNTNSSEKESIAAMYVLLMRHFLDQGFQSGSAMGTLHHLGYSLRNFYTAAFLMKEPLREAQLDKEVQQAMEWFAGTGEVKIKPIEPGMDIDAFNTSLVGRLSSILMLTDSPEKTRYLYAFTRWIDNGFLYTNGTADGFKIDGSIFHHCANYPAYAIGGLEGAVTANQLLYNTKFQLNTLGREHLKKAMLAMREYCNLQTWPLSLSGRHPDGIGHLMPEYFAQLALTGTPDYSAKIDTELAAAYLRLETKPTTKYTKIFQKEGIEPEKSPEGNWSYNYSCLAVHRRDNWMVTAMGFSRYLWATETYVGANMYGRYLNHGNLQLMTSGNPISNQGSGFNKKGWDWNHFPGTTAAVLPLNELRANVKNLDANSGYEEMLLSDESFVGSLSLQNNQGVFGMKLHENNKYNGSLHARKSYFFFNNRIIALGSGICSALADKSVNTTLFQVYLPKRETSIGVNGTEVTTFPYSVRLDKGQKYLSDGLNNYFFVKQGNLQITKSLQKSFDEETEEPTQNDFVLASIDHGPSPKNEAYEYMILVQPNADEVQKTVKTFNSKKKSTYNILQQDSMAHIVVDKPTNTTGYVLFEAGKLKIKSELLSVSSPCLIMTTKSNKNQLVISVCDLDLHFYDGKADLKYDSAGKPVERSVYSMSWRNNPSAESQIEIQIKDIWKTAAPSDFIKVKKQGNETTTLIVKCQHAFNREIVLQKL